MFMVNKDYHYSLMHATQRGQHTTPCQVNANITPFQFTRFEQFCFTKMRQLMRQ